MRYGMGYGCSYGDPETWVITLDVADIKSGVSYTFLSLISQYYQLVIDGRNAGSPVYVAAGATKTLTGKYSLPTAPHLVSVVGCGPWSSPGAFDVTGTQRAYGELLSDRIDIQIVGTPEQFSFNDNGQLSNWNISGINRFTNCSAVSNRPTWGELTFSLITTDETHVLTIYKGNTVVAAGSIKGNGTITITERNNSGVAAFGTNTVDLNYVSEITNETPISSDLAAIVYNDSGYPIYAR